MQKKELEIKQGELDVKRQKLQIDGRHMADKTQLEEKRIELRTR